MVTKKFSVYAYFVFIILPLQFINGARILGVFPIRSKSHSAFTTSIMKSLLADGHEIVIVSPFGKQNTDENFTIINSFCDPYIQSLQSDIGDLIKMNAYERLKFINDMETDHCYNFMKLKEIQHMIKSPRQRFDVMFVEILTMYQCFLPLARKLRIPVIGIVAQRSWLYADFAVNNPNNPATLPSTMRTYWKRDSFIERFVNVLFYAMKIFLRVNTFQSKLNKFYADHEEYFGEPETSDISNLSLIFFNSNPALLPRPMNPNSIEIGGIHIKPEKPLPTNIQKFIDESEKGVILFSFGSIAKGNTIDERSLSALTQAFAEIPQRVIWKYEGKLENLPPNVMVEEWIPQRDILAHKKVVAFISHCGLNSVYESIYTATPVIAVPLFGDQPSNAAILEQLGVAVHLDFNSFTKQDVLDSINAVVNESRYKEKMKKLSILFKDRPISAQKLVTYWTEYVIRHKGALHMQPTKLPWYQHFLLDVVSFFIFILSVLFYISYKFVNLIC